MQKLPDTLTERQRECVIAFAEADQSERATAKVLGIDVKAVRNNLWLAHRKGVNFSADTFCEHAPAGFEITNSTLHIKGDEVVQSWPGIRPTAQKEEEIFDYLEHRIPISPIKIKKPNKVNDDLQLEWTLADCHYGMLAWGKETGEDYNLKIARALVLDSAREIFRRAGKVKETVLVLMGDNFHTDFKTNVTEKSHNSLDVDSRYSKIVLSGAETFISAIEACLQFSEKVRVIVLYGNHDAQTSVNLQYMLYFNFRGVNDRVEVDLSPAKARYNRWGRTITQYHHGDGTKPARQVQDLQSYIAENDITGTRYWYAKQAHQHKEEIVPFGKVRFEIVPSPVASDAYAAGANFSSQRATVATLYDKERGELDRYTIYSSSLKRTLDFLG